MAQSQQYGKILLKAVLISLLAGIAYPLSFYILGYLFFPLIVLYWVFFFIALLYFGVRIVRVSKEMNKQSS